jgi:subtilisin family serine protease
MKRLLVALTIFAMCGSILPAVAATKPAPPQWESGRLTVNFSPSVGKLENLTNHGEAISIGIPSVDELMARYHVKAMQRIVDDGTLGLLKVVPDFFRLVVLYCPVETDIPAMVADFSKNPMVEYAEPDYLYPVDVRTPSDPRWNSQWDKRIMQLPTAWDFSTGSPDMIVCAVDGGVWWKHADLYDNLWVNPGEDINHNGLQYSDTTYPGDQDDIDGIDNDDDGKVDDLIGWDFLVNAVGCETGEDCDGTQDNDPVSLNDHGTHVTGLMGATGNNGIGIAGCNWNIKVMATRAGYLDHATQQGLILQDAAIGCMEWAVAKGAKVLNMSFGSSNYSSAESQAITNCWSNGAIICAAAGNDNGETIPHYPAAYPHVIAVGSTNTNDAVSDFSNYGTWVDCFAPGNMVMSTVIPGYAEYPGTSMASPNAAGVIALIWSIFPDRNNQEIEDVVLANCDDISGINSTIPAEYLGHGRVNAAKTLSSAFPYLTITSVAVINDTDGDHRLEEGESGDLFLSFHNDAAWQGVADLQFTVSSNDPCLSVTSPTFGFDMMEPGDDHDNASSLVHLNYLTGVNSAAHFTTLDIAVTGSDGFHFRTSTVIRVGRPQTLLVADDGTASYRNLFATALGQRDADGMYYNYDLWDVSVFGDPVFDDIHEYGYVLWVCGNDSTTTLSAANEATLAQYLDGGGRLMLAGQGIDADISSDAFYADYLHAQHVDGLGGLSLSGVNDDPISGGTNLLLRGGGCGGNGNVHPSKISPINGAVAIYNYPGPVAGALRFENTTYKVAYYAFALEAACGTGGTTHYSDVVRHTMNWLGAAVTSADQPQSAVLPQGFALHPNYPNPFNPTTTISYDLPYSTEITLRVFDVEGRQVELLAKGRVQAGTHELQFDGSDLASGTYFVNLQADKFTATERMILMK